MSRTKKKFIPKWKLGKFYHEKLMNELEEKKRLRDLEQEQEIKAPETVQEFEQSECLKEDRKNHLKEGTTSWRGLLYEKGLLGYGGL